MKDELSEAAVASALRTAWVGRSYQYFERAGSTNDLLKQQVATGGANDPPPGAVLLTDYQENGRGRFDRSWEAPQSSSLLFSLLFRPDWAAPRLSWLVMLAGLAVAEAIEEVTKAPIFLKWPNDVLVKHEDSWSKVSGILLEGSITPAQRLEHAILGIGINVNVATADLPTTAQPATSLMVATGNPVSRLSLFSALLLRLERWYETADGNVSPQPQWNKHLITLGQTVEVKRIGQEISMVGTAEATDKWGQLLVRDDKGQLHSISAADVTLRAE